MPNEVIQTVELQETELQKLQNLENIEKRKKLVNAGSMHAFHWLVILLSIVLTFSAWYYAKTQLHQKLETKFQRYSEQVVDLVIERMGLYENALWSGVAFIDSVETDITYPQWLAYANSLKIDLTYPGVNGIGVIYNILPHQLDEYMVKQQVFRPDYVLHPKHQEIEYWPITYIEPLASNKKAVGLDMAFEINRYYQLKKQGIQEKHS